MRSNEQSKGDCMPILMCGPREYFRRHFLSKSASDFLDALMLHVEQCLIPISPGVGTEHAPLDFAKKQVKIECRHLLKSWPCADQKEVESVFKSECIKAGWADATIRIEQISSRDTPNLIVTLALY